MGPAHPIKGHSFVFAYLIVICSDYEACSSSFAKHSSNFSPVSTPQHHSQGNNHHCTPGGETEAQEVEETDSGSGSGSSAGSCLRYTLESGIELGMGAVQGGGAVLPQGLGHTHSFCQGREHEIFTKYINKEKERIKGD